MEITITEYLGEKDLDAGATEFLQVDAARAQRVDARDRQAVHPGHDHDLGCAVVPIHLGHREQDRALEIASQLGAVRGFPDQVEFVVEVLGELVDDLAWL
jgi:hypothetical protein